MPKANHSLKKVKVRPLFHRGEAQFGLFFPKDFELIELVKSLSGARWSQSNKCWYVKNTPENVQAIGGIFKGKAIVSIDPELTDKQQQENKPEKLNNKKDLMAVENSLAQFKNWLRSKRYSESTVKTYSEALRVFFRFYSGKRFEEITNEDVIRFNNEYILANGYSASYQNQAVNAIKLFYRTIERRNLDLDAIHRPRREHKLPNVLSKEEVKAVLDSPRNIKHKVMLSLIYACGLRRSELINLKPNDIDSKRNLLIVRQSKGKKDRMIPLSKKIIDMLREYYKAYRPKVWLFEGQKAGEKYTATSLQNVLKQALKASKINKPVTLHWLRHSYATHLLESGTDLRYIQEILGHKSSRTTEIYTHVSTKSLQNIKSPFDDL